MAKVREWNDASGAHTELMRPDGSWKRWTNGVVTGEGGPDPAKAEVYAAGNYDAVSEAIRYGDAMMASPYYQQIREQERLVGETARKRGDEQYGLQVEDRDLNREKFGLSEREYDRRFGLDERESDRRFGLDERKFGLDERETTARIAELERRFGLDAAQQGIDFFKTAADYGKTARSWLDATQFQSPTFMSRFAQGLSNPAFGATGTPAAMNTITDRVAESTGGGTLNNNLYDPAKAVQNILKGSPPSANSGFTGQDIAAVNLIAEIFKNGGQNMKEGAWESYTPDQREFTKGVMDYIQPGGGDFFEQQIARSRIPTRSNPFSAV